MPRACSKSSRCSWSISSGVGSMSGFYGIPGFTSAALADSATSTRQGLASTALSTPCSLRRLRFRHQLLKPLPRAQFVAPPPDVVEVEGAGGLHRQDVAGVLPVLDALRSGVPPELLDDDIFRGRQVCRCTQKRGGPTSPETLAVVRFISYEEQLAREARRAVPADVARRQGYRLQHHLRVELQVRLERLKERSDVA